MPAHPKILIGIPVYNEAQYVDDVLSKVRAYGHDILVVDDGSTDGTPMHLAKQPVEVARHAVNRGYGRSMQDMLRWGCCGSYEWLVTMDCDLQHEPSSIPDFVAAIDRDDADVISGSRYLSVHPENDAPPADRQSINHDITLELNARLDLSITDAFCGFKAYRLRSCASLPLDADGYDFPMQFWVQAAAASLRIKELPVRLIYNDPNRTFGGPLDEAVARKRHYVDTMHRELLHCADQLPACATAGIEDIVLEA
jgi:glycosyltransferase involved in cell wall biosynthesis